MSISPSLFPNEPRYLYFRPLVSKGLHFASTSELRRRPYRSVQYNGVKNVLTSHALGQAFNFQGTLFMGMSRESGIACWNRYNPLDARNIVSYCCSGSLMKLPRTKARRFQELVAVDEKRLQYPNGVKVVPPCEFNPLDEELLVLSNRFAGFQLQNLLLTEVNFRVLSSPVQRLIYGTKCALARRN